MKKKLIFLPLILLCFAFTVYAITDSFKFDSSKLSFVVGNNDSKVEASFKKEYALEQSISDNAIDDEEAIIDLSKRVTYLLLGDMSASIESSENYYKRTQEFKSIAAYNHYPKDSSTKSGYDESNELYKHIVSSQYAIPQVFNKFNELGIVYNSYGDIRVTESRNLVLSTVTLPDVEMKSESSEDPMKYERVKTNLVLYYYFLKIDNNYYLYNLFGETVDNIGNYFNTIEDEESHMMNISEYKSNASSIYDYSKLENVSEDRIAKIYEDNKKTIVYLTSHYNNVVIDRANGFFINNNLIVTTWDFIERALSSSQYIMATDPNGNAVIIEGIVTINSNTDVAILKVKEKNDTHVIISNNELNIEDPVFMINSKTGIGLSVQKGILISNKGYIQSTIPVHIGDEGSPLFDSEGNVVGLNTSKLTDASMSIGVRVEVLKEIQDKFTQDQIEYIPFDELKSKFYYTKYDEEIIKNNIPKNKWSEYSKIGNIEENIKLELIKASYKDGIVSLRYKNGISEYIGSMELAGPFIESLLDSGFKESSKSSNRAIYESRKYQVIVRDEGNYLIIVMVKK